MTNNIITNPDAPRTGDNSVRSYTITQSSENKQATVFIDDSWVYSESATPKQKFQKPVLWVHDIASVGKLATLFDVVQYDDGAEAPKGGDRTHDTQTNSTDHYLIAEKHTPEELIKTTGWMLKASGIDCKVYPVQTSLESLIGHESTSINEVVLQIIEFAQTFDDWAQRTDELPLTTRAATQVARSAIARLTEFQKSVELATLRKRCGESSYDWNRLMATLEEEFHKELHSKQAENSEKPTNHGTSKGRSIPSKSITEFTQVALKTLYGDKPWICINNKLYFWSDTYYEQSSDDVEIRRIAEFCDTYPVKQRNGTIRYSYANPQSVEKVLKWVKSCLKVKPELVNPPGLNCTNGVLQLLWDGEIPSWILVDHNPNFYYIYPPVATYNPDADPIHCDRLLSALEPQSRDIFLKTIAASLDLATVRKFKGRAVRALLLKGDGSNGKDSLREVVSMMYGRQGLTSCTLADFVAYDTGRKFPLSKLIHSVVNWASENTNTARLDRIQSLKAFITGDPIDCERKGVDAREFSPTGIAIFNVNDTPNLQGTLEAIASRYGILEFNKTFKIGADPAKGELEADPRFKYDPIFMASMVVPAFLNHVLTALVDLMKNGIDYSCTRSTLENIQSENSHLFQFCQDVGLNYNPDSILSANEIWTVLEQWYRDNGTLDYEELKSGKLKAIWVEQANKSDKNIKAANQVIPRFLQLFPKAKKVTIAHPSGKKTMLAIQGIGFNELESTPISTVTIPVSPQEPPQQSTHLSDFHPNHPNFSNGEQTVKEQVSEVCQIEDLREQTTYQSQTETVSTQSGWLGCDAQSSSVSENQTEVDEAVDVPVIENKTTPTNAIAKRCCLQQIVLETSLTTNIDVTSIQPLTDSISEWMTEENLQSMANDLEECEDIEMLKIIREIYNTESLKIAARRISLGKQKQIRLWVAQLDGLG